MFRTFTFLAALAGCAVILSAQAIDPDTFKVSYFGVPSNVVEITNVGTSGGNICSDIYVFDTAQEMVACCSCLETPDGLRTISVKYNLLMNTLTGEFPLAGAIKILSAATTGGTCPLPTAPKPTPGIRAWQAHFESVNPTETNFLDAGLSAAELAGLGAQCSAIKLVGSGHGVCQCGTGD